MAGARASCFDWDDRPTAGRRRQQRFEDGGRGPPTSATSQCTEHGIRKRTRCNCIVPKSVQVQRLYGKCDSVISDVYS